jgi:DNA-binding beta-propeller fold protein YncE
MVRRMLPIMLFGFFLTSSALALVFRVDAVFEEVGGEIPLLDYPVGIAVDDAGGRVFVSDWGNNRVLVLEKTGKLLREIRNLKSPAGLALDREGRKLFVVEQKGNRVTVFDLETLSPQGNLKTKKTPLSEPRGIWVAQDGTVYVADTGRSRIVVFGVQGEELFAFGREGMGDNEFYQPRGVAQDPQERIWVVDTLHHCVKVFDGKGNYLFRFGEGLNQPRYVGFFGDLAFLSDYRNHRILVYDLQGVLQGAIGEEEKLFSFPEGLWIDGEGKLWVADAGNNRIVRIDLGYLAHPEEYLKTLLAEGKDEEFFEVLGRLSPEVRRRPEIGRLLFEAYRRRGDLEALIAQAEELFLSDEEERSRWKRTLGELYAERGRILAGQGAFEEAKDFLLRSFRYGRLASLFSYLWVAFLGAGGEYLGILLLLVLLGVLLFVYFRLRAERERRWRRW